MATKNIVPRSNDEGKVGTGTKKWNAVNATKLYGKLQIPDYTETTVSANDDYLPIYDASNSEIRKISVANLGTGGINTLDIRPENLSLDSTETGTSRGSVFGIYETIDFPNSVNGAAWYTFKLPDEWGTSNNIGIELAYSMNGNDPSKIVKIDTDAWLVESGDQPDDSVPDYSASDNITTDSDNIGKYAEITLTNGTVTSANIPSGCLSVAIKLTRDVGSDTYTGSFQLISLRLTSA